MGKDPLRFKGFDWSELGPVLGLDYDNFKTDEEALLAFQEALLHASFRHDGKGDVEIANGVRQFLVALEKCGGYLTPFYRGLRSIEHDGVMLGITASNLGCLWS